jgi:hypothetical protein
VVFSLAYWTLMPGSSDSFPERTTASVDESNPSSVRTPQDERLLAVAQFLEQRKTEGSQAPQEAPQVSISDVVGNVALRVPEGTVRSWFGNENASQFLGNLIILSMVPWTGDPRWSLVQSQALEQMAKDPSGFLRSALDAVHRIPDTETELKQEVFRLAVQCAQASGEFDSIRQVLEQENQATTAQENPSYQAALTTFMTSVQPVPESLAPAPESFPDPTPPSE